MQSPVEPKRGKKENKKRIQSKILLAEVEFSRKIKWKNLREINVAELAWKNNERNVE